MKKSTLLYYLIFYGIPLGVLISTIVAIDSSYNNNICVVVNITKFDCYVNSGGLTGINVYYEVYHDSKLKIALDQCGIVPECNLGYCNNYKPTSKEFCHKFVADRVVFGVDGFISTVFGLVFLNVFANTFLFLTKSNYILEEQPQLH